MSNLKPCTTCKVKEGVVFHRDKVLCPSCYAKLPELWRHPPAGEPFKPHPTRKRGSV